jgi:hypothetical protein
LAVRHFASTHSFDEILIRVLGGRGLILAGNGKFLGQKPLENPQRLGESGGGALRIDQRTPQGRVD